MHSPCASQDYQDELLDWANKFSVKDIVQQHLIPQGFTTLESILAGIKDITCVYIVVLINVYVY
jgi:hypothetical protein